MEPGSSDEQLGGSMLCKKGTPWTVEEHYAFLQGLEKLGRGNWRGISRLFVPSRTPTQVASHAQKHFLRQTGHTKRRSRFSAIEEEVLGPRPAGKAHSPTSSTPGAHHTYRDGYKATVAASIAAKAQNQRHHQSSMPMVQQQHAAGQRRQSNGTGNGQQFHYATSSSSTGLPVEHASLSPSELQHDGTKHVMGMPEGCLSAEEGSDHGIAHGHACAEHPHYAVPGWGQPYAMPVVVKPANAPNTAAVNEGCPMPAMPMQAMHPMYWAMPNAWPGHAMAMQAYQHYAVAAVDHDVDASVEHMDDEHGSVSIAQGVPCQPQMPMMMHPYYGYYGMPAAGGYAYMPGMMYPGAATGVPVTAMAEAITMEQLPRESEDGDGDGNNPSSSPQTEDAPSESPASSTSTTQPAGSHVNAAHVLQGTDSGCGSGSEEDAAQKRPVKPAAVSVAPRKPGKASTPEVNTLLNRLGTRQQSPVPETTPNVVAVGAVQLHPSQHSAFRVLMPFGQAM